LRRLVGDGAGGWETTYRELGDQVAGVAAGLQAAGLRPGQRMVLMMRNRPEFHVVDLAATFLRATPVSIYNSSSAEELQYLVDHAEAEIAIVEDIGFLERFLKVRAELPRLRRIFVIDPPVDGPPDDVEPYDVLLSFGRADLEALGEATDPDGGIVLLDAGQLVFDADGNLVRAPGRHPQFFGATFCDALMPKG
jgi:long-chain acyl-CoA synthetase